MFRHASSASSTLLKQAFPRFFKSLTTTIERPLPYSKEFVEKQLQVLKEKQIIAEKVSLKKGTKFLGLNTHFEVDLVLDSSPVYHAQELKFFSEVEKSNWRNMSEHYMARVVDYEVTDDVECAATKSKSGYTAYYLHVR